MLADVLVLNEVLPQIAQRRMVASVPDALVTESGLDPSDVRIDDLDQLERKPFTVTECSKDIRLRMSSAPDGPQHDLKAGEFGCRAELPPLPCRLLQLSSLQHILSNASEVRRMPRKCSNRVGSEAKLLLVTRADSHSDTLRQLRTARFQDTPAGLSAPACTLASREGRERDPGNRALLLCLRTSLWHLSPSTPTCSAGRSPSPG